MATLALVNPRHKRKSRKHRARRRRHVVARSHRKHRRRKHVVARRHRNPRRRHRVMARRLRRRNPRLVGGIVGALKSTLIPAAIGGVGAVALDAAMGQVPLPVSLQGKMAKVAIKFGGAVLLGMLAGRFLGAEKGKAVALGGATVVLYNILRDGVKQVAPNLPLAGLSAVDYGDSAVGAYMAPGLNGLGYTNPAPFVQEGMGAYMSDGM